MLIYSSALKQEQKMYRLFSVNLGKYVFFFMWILFEMAYGIKEITKYKTQR